MVCPYCRQKTSVSNSRQRRAGFSVWRRRHCGRCNISFTTSESISLESVIASESPQGSLDPLGRASVHASIFKALEGSENAAGDAETLAASCVDKLLAEKKAVLPQKTVERHIFETLSAVDPLAGQRYLLNELRRTRLSEPEESPAD